MTLIWTKSSLFFNVRFFVLYLELFCYLLQHWSWRPGQEATLAPPCSNLRSFGSKCVALKKAHVILLGFSAPPVVIRRPRSYASFSPSLRHCSAVRDSGVDRHDTGGATGSQFPGRRITMGAPNHCRGHRMTAGCAVKSQQCHKYFLQYSAFAFKIPQVRTQGHQTCLVGPFGATKLATPRGVTRKDGARCKNQIWRRHIWIWGLMEANRLYWRRYLWHCWKFSAPPAVIRRPHSHFGARGIALPLHPLVTPLNGIVVFCNIKISGCVYCRK